MKSCYCGSDQPFSKCCNPIIKGIVNANSAEKLMRSRYSAYVVGATDYLIATTHVSERQLLSKKEIEQWAKTNVWQKLEIVKADTFSVEFKAYFRDRSGKNQVHHEKSTFVFEDGKWLYVDGIFNEAISNAE